MGNFYQKTFQEKIKTIKEEESEITNLSHKKYLLIRILLLMPILLFIVMTIFYRFNDGFIAFFYSFLMSISLIFTGVILYSRMIR